MISTVLRTLISRSAFKSGQKYALSSTATTSKTLGNILLAQGRLFSVSTRVASPAARTTTNKKSTTKSAPKKKATGVKKTTAASKKKTTATKRKAAAPKKRKVAAKKKVTVRKLKVKKVVPVKATPRNDASLRAPPRAMSAYSLYVKRMWPTLSPKPTSAPAGMVQVRQMWASLTDAEKKPFFDETSTLNTERRQAYDKWRAGLSMADVRAINAYRANTKHNKLGGTPSSATKKPIKGYLKFYQTALKDGTIDLKKAPTGTTPVIYAAKEAARLWKGMSTTEKATYM